MLLSVAFITHNRKDELLRALNSCISCMPSNTEFIIVDNASDDGTEEYIKNEVGEKIDLVYE